MKSVSMNASEIISLICRLYTEYVNNDYKPVELTTELVDTLMQIKRPISMPCPFKVSPEVAKYLLDKYNKKNRAATNSTIDSYAKKMKEGKWHLNGESIIFSTSERLSDGQHRDEASYKSGCAFDTFVTCGVSDDAVATIDTGKGRSAKDALSFCTDKSSKNSLLAQMIKTCIYFDRGTLAEHGASSTRATAASNEEVKDFYEAHEEICNKVYDLAITWQKAMKESSSDSFTKAELGFGLYLAVHGESLITINNFFLGICKPATYADGCSLLINLNVCFSRKWHKKEIVERREQLKRAWKNYKSGNFGVGLRRIGNKPTTLKFAE